MNLYTCQNITVRNDNCIDVRSEMLNSFCTYQLSNNAVEFVMKAGDDAGAFTKEGNGSANLLLLYNSKTGEIFIPEKYSEEERVKIRQTFIKFLMNKPKVTYKFIEM